MRLDEFLVGYIRAKVEPTIKEDFNSLTVWELSSAEELTLNSGDEIYGILDNGNIINRIFENTNSTYMVILSTGEQYAPEKFKVLGKVFK